MTDQRWAHPRLLAIAWIALCLLAAVGAFVAVLPISTAGCAPPGDPQHAACMQMIWGRALTITIGAAILAGAIGYPLLYGRWTTAVSARIRRRRWTPTPTITQPTTTTTRSPREGLPSRAWRSAPRSTA